MLTPPPTPPRLSRAKQHLISSRQYPESLSGLRYDPTFSVRGVAYDTKRGFLLKLDFLHCVWDAFFGRRVLPDAPAGTSDSGGGAHSSGAD